METTIRPRWSRAEQASACEFLGLLGDGYRHERGPHVDHRCFRTSPGRPIDPAHQQHYCLSGRCRSCPIFQQRSATLLLPPNRWPELPNERLLGRPAAGARPARAGRVPAARLWLTVGISLAVATVMLVALLIALPLPQPLALPR